MGLSKGKILLSSALILSTSLFVSGCGDKSWNGSSSSEVVVAPVINKPVLTVTGTVVDAKTLAPIGGVNITYAGTGSADIVEKTTTSEAKTGLVTFTSKNKTTNVNVQVSKDGYVDTGLQLNLVDVTESSFQIKMVKIDATPTGVASIQKSVDASVNNGGTIQNPIEVSTTVTNSTVSHGETTKVVIPADTVLTSATGAKVTGALKVITTHYSAQEANSIQLFPGGFAVLATTPDSNATAETEKDITFVTAGFTSIVIENEKGEKVKNFSKPIEVKMQIKEGTTNPDKNKAIAIGDIVPVWSYNEDTGKWVYEEDETITDLNTTDDFYNVVVKAAHLSYWSLGWFFSKTCDKKTRINIVDSNDNLVTGQQLYMTANFVGVSSYFHSGYIYNDGFALLDKIPEDKNITIQAYLSNDRSTPLGHTMINVSDSDCANSKVYTLPIDASKFPKTIKQIVKVREVCANGVVNRESVPNLYSFAYNQNYSSILGYGYTDANGEVSYNVVEGENATYYVRVGNESSWVRPSTGYYDQFTHRAVDANDDGISDTVITRTVTLTGNTQKCLDTGSTGGTGGVN